MKPMTILACLLAATACSSNGPSPKIAVARDVARAGSGEGAPEAPLQLRWQVLSDAGGRLSIAAVVVRKAVLDSPIDVHVEVPAGLHLVSGQTSFQLPPNAQPGETTTTFEFTYATVPAGDLKLVADLSGGAMGVHATDTYRFGRPEPQPVRPQPTGPSIKIGDTDLGPAIQIDTK